MELEVKMTTEYNSIFDSFMEYLKEETDKILGKMDENKTTLLRSWEGTRVAGLKMKSVVKNQNGETLMDFANFQDIQERWGANHISS
jgi:hypothetical protein